MGDMDEFERVFGGVQPANKQNIDSFLGWLWLMMKTHG